MRRLRLFAGLLGLTAIASASTPFFESRDLYLSGTKLGTGVAAYGIAENGTHWYYSHASITGGRVGAKLIGASETSIESWSDKDGFPIKAIYTAVGADKTTTTTVTVKGGQVLMEELTEYASGVKSHRSATVDVPAGASVQMSQFNPVDIKMPPGVDTVSLLIVEPVTLSAEQARLRKIASGTRVVNGQAMGQESRFTLETGAGQSIIRVAGDGRLIWTVNSQGFEMMPTPLTREQNQELSEVANRMGG